MIDEELERKAKFYGRANKCLVCCDCNYYDSEEDLVDACIAGAKENGVVWHNLKTNPNDLPKNQNEVLCCLWEDTYDIGYYKNDDEMWYFNEFNVSKDEVDAWCELPKFEVEE